MIAPNPLSCICLLIAAAYTPELPPGFCVPYSSSSPPINISPSYSALFPCSSLADLLVSLLCRSVPSACSISSLHPIIRANKKTLKRECLSRPPRVPPFLLSSRRPPPIPRRLAVYHLPWLRGEGFAVRQAGNTPMPLGDCTCTFIH